MKRRLLAVLLCAALFVTAMPAAVFGLDDDIIEGYCGIEEGNQNLTYTLNKATGVLDIYGTGEMVDFGYQSNPFLGVSLTKVTIHEGVTSIGSHAFRLNPDLTEVTLPSTLTAIGYNAFNQCQRLTSIDLPSGLTSIGDAAFGACGLKQIDIPAGVKTLPDSVFYRCEQLESVTLHDGLELIDTYAFGSCSSLNTLTLPSTVETFSEKSVLGSENLSWIQVAERNPKYYSSFGVVFSRSGEKTSLVAYPPGRSGSYQIPDSVNTIEDGAFAQCRKLSHVSVPNTLQIAFGDYLTNLFNGCKLLKTAGPEGSGSAIEFEYEDALPAGLFDGADCLEFAIVPEGIQTIREMTFTNCENLKRIYLPSTLTEINTRAFSSGDIFKIKDIYFGGSKDAWEALPGHDVSAFSDAVIHYDRSRIGVYIEPVDFGPLAVNKRGTATQWFLLGDQYGEPFGDRPIQVQTNGGEKEFIYTDLNGMVGITTDPLIADEHFDVVFSSNSYRPLFGTEQSFDVKVKQLSYTHELEGSLGFDQALGFQFAPFKAGGNRNLSGNLSISDEYNDGKRTVSVSYGDQNQAGATMGAGIDLDSTGIQDVTLKGATRGISKGDTYQNGITVENYKEGDTEQSIRIAAVVASGMISTLSNAVSVMDQDLTSKLKQYVSVLIESYDQTYRDNASKTQSIQITGKTEYCSASSGGVNATLYRYGESTKYAFTGGIDLSDPGSRTRNYTNTIVTSEGAGVGSDIEYQSEGDSSSTGFENGEYILGASRSNHKEVTVTKDYDTGSLKSVSYRTYQGDEKSLATVLSKAADTYSTVTFTGDEAQKLYNDISMIRMVADEKTPLLNIQMAIDKMIRSDAKGAFQETTKDRVGFDVGLPVKIGNSHIKYKITPEFSGEESFSWTSRTGGVLNGKTYDTVVSSVEIGEIRTKDGGKDLSKIVVSAIEQVMEEIESFFDSVEGNVRSGVKNGMAEIAKASVGYDLYAVVRKLISDNTKNAAPKLLTAKAGTESACTAVGEPYRIEVYTDESCETPAAEAQLAAQPLQLVLHYDEDLLTEAGIDPTADGRQLGIYRFDGEQNLYVLQESVWDPENSLVTMQLTQSGEYILAADMQAPVFDSWEQTNFSEKPAFRIHLSDASAISDFLCYKGSSLTSSNRVDLVDMEHFADYYDPQTGWFEYAFEEPTTGGYINFVAEDSHGNRAGNSDYRYWMSTSQPKGPLTVLDLPDTLYGDNSLTIKCTWGENRPLGVGCACTIDGKLYQTATMEYSSADKAWEAEIMLPEGEYDMEIVVSVVGSNKVAVSSEPVTVHHEELPEMPAEEAGTMLASYYDQEGKMLDLADLNSTGQESEPEDAAQIKIFRIDRNGIPQDRAMTLELW